MSAAPPAGRPFERWRRPHVTLAVHALALAFALVPTVPVVWVLFTAFKDRTRVIAHPLRPPEVWHWENFVDAWRLGNFSTYFRNSLVVAVPTVFGILLLALMAAYVFATMEFFGRKPLLAVFLLGLAVPLSVLIIPLFYEMRAFDLLSTPWALILPQIAKQLPFGTLLLYSFIRDLPNEILDAGRVDGCNRWQLLRHLVLPMTGPALLTLLIFSSMWTWNQFLLPSVLIHNDSARTLPIGLRHFQGEYVTDWPLLMAGATITFLPVVVLYVAFQRHFIRGISAGALN